MADGPGKYDDECTMVREQTGAVGVLVIVFGGEKGSGFSVQCPPDLIPHIPVILTTIANELKDDLDNMKRSGL